MIYSLVLISMVSLFLSGSLYTTDNFRFLQPYLLIGSCSIILIIALVTKIDKIRLDLTAFILFLIFVFLSIISSVIHSSFELLSGVLVLLFIYISLIVLLPNFRFKVEKFIIPSLMIGHIPIILFPLLFMEMKTRSYSGIFYNPNSFGVVVVVLFATILAKFTFILENHFMGLQIKKIKIWGYTLTLSICFFLIIISSSRTSALAAILLLVTCMFFLFKKSYKNSKIQLKYAKKFASLVMLLLFLIVPVLMFTPISDLIFESLIEKFIRKSNDILDGRLYVWYRTISEIQIFGHGRDYFTTLGLGAHNTFISILGQYGLLPLLFFILFLGRILRNSLKILRFRTDENKYLAFISIFLFLILSMAEGMMLKTSMLLMFSTAGFITKADS